MSTTAVDDCNQAKMPAVRDKEEKQRMKADTRRKLLSAVRPQQTHTAAPPSTTAPSSSAEQLVAAALQGWTQCCFFLSRKARFCNVTRSPGSNFCGNHRPDDEPVPQRVLKRTREDQDQVVRVPCPVDPSHTVYHHNLSQHIKICNANKRDVQLRSEPFYCENCNSGPSIDKDQDVSVDDIASINVMELLHKITQCYTTSELQEAFSDEPPRLTLELSAVYDRIVCSISKAQTSFHHLRHAHQDASLVTCMIEHNLLDPDENAHTINGSRTYCELGAGKGMLGLAISVASPKSTIVMVERSGLRHKADKTMRLALISFHRVRMDIRHVLLRSIPGLEDAPVDGSTIRRRRLVIAAKHLCGVATDLAIRSLQQLKTTDPDSAEGLAIATCCHHACSYSDYCGFEFLQRHGFTRAEFEVLTVWSAWAHTLDNSSGNSKKAKPSSNVLSQLVDRASNSISSAHDACKEHEIDTYISPLRALRSLVPRPSHLSNLEMSVVGKQIKRILDQGRVDYLKSLGFDAKTVRYCSSDLSPECYVVVARIPSLKKSC